MKCPVCAQLPKSALRMGKPRHYLLAASVGLSLAAAFGLSHTPIRVVAFAATALGLLAGPLLAGLGPGFISLPRWLLMVVIASGIADLPSSPLGDD